MLKQQQQQLDRLMHTTRFLMPPAESATTWLTIPGVTVQECRHSRVLQSQQNAIADLCATLFVYHHWEASTVERADPQSILSLPDVNQRIAARILGGQ